MLKNAYKWLVATLLCFMVILSAVSPTYALASLTNESLTISNTVDPETGTYTSYYVRSSNLVTTKLAIYFPDSWVTDSALRVRVYYGYDLPLSPYHATNGFIQLNPYTIGENWVYLDLSQLSNSPDDIEIHAYYTTINTPSAISTAWTNYGFMNSTVYMEDMFTMVSPDVLSAFQLGYDQARQEYGYYNNGEWLTYQDGYEDAQDLYGYYNGSEWLGYLDGYDAGSTATNGLFNFIPAIVGPFFGFFFQMASIRVMGISPLDILATFALIGVALMVFKTFIQN